MPFAKGNQLWKEGVKAKNENKEKLELFLYIMATGGISKYGDMMDKLAQGAPLNKEEEQYMDRMEGWREFLIPKLARNEVTGKDGKDLPSPILNYAIHNNDSHEETSGNDKKD